MCDGSNQVRSDRKHQQAALLEGRGELRGRAKPRIHREDDDVRIDHRGPQLEFLDVADDFTQSLCIRVVFGQPIDVVV